MIIKTIFLIFYLGIFKSIISYLFCAKRPPNISLTFKSVPELRRRLGAFCALLFRTKRAKGFIRLKQLLDASFSILLRAIFSLPYYLILFLYLPVFS